MVFAVAVETLLAISKRLEERQRSAAVPVIDLLSLRRLHGPTEVGVGNPSTRLSAHLGDPQDQIVIDVSGQLQFFDRLQIRKRLDPVSPIDFQMADIF